MNDDTPHSAVMGRPSIYTDEIIKEFCGRISVGRSVRSVCCDKDMPSRETFYKSIRENTDLSDQYREAVKQRAEYHFDEMLDIADEVEAEAAEIAKAKLQIDTRKWILSRMDATKYGDKQQVDNVSSDGSMSPPQPLTPESAKAISKDLDDEY